MSYEIKTSCNHKKKQIFKKDYRENANFTTQMKGISTKCFSQDIRDKKKQFADIIDISNDLIDIINTAYGKLTAKNDGETFYSPFYSTVILNSSSYLFLLGSPFFTFLSQKLAEKIFFHYKKPNEQNQTKPYYNSNLTQSQVEIMDLASAEENSDCKLISALSHNFSS